MADNEKPTHDALLDRPDARRNVEEGTDAYDLLCLRCGFVRGTGSRDHLPEPGFCYRCEGNGFSEYWTRDWKEEGRADA